MIRFVDLETGNTFDGSYPYIFWLDGEQSINLIYSKPICFISNSQEVEVSIEANDIFNLIDASKLVNSELNNIYGFEYYDLNLLKTNKLTSVGHSHHNYFVHIIYIIASAAQAGEYITEFQINNDVYNIGGDFYGENETLYINMSNNGIEIPEAIQKAIYGTDIHEEKRDNILLNRKWKELLSNYWDVIANKGSYKSLFNSLEWFEYGDKVSLCEIWKNTDTNNFFSKDIQQVLEEKYFDTLNGFSKTTYFSIYYALEKYIMKNNKVVLDAEKNPELEYVISKWSTQNLALKLSMLGNFYKTYFMPIHADLIHSTIEDIVYSNTFKTRLSTTSNRSDYIYQCDDILCNIKDGDIFRLDKVQCYVGPNTLFGSDPEITTDPEITGSNAKNDTVIVGVQRETVTDSLISNDAAKKFLTQYYNEIGSIIDFDINIPLISGDKIKRSVLVFKTYRKENAQYKSFYKTNIEHKILNSNVQFSLLCPIEGEYEVRLQFDTIAGNIYTKRVKFNVIDTSNIGLGIYRIHNKPFVTKDDLLKPSQLNDYIFNRRVQINSTGKPIIQYLPASIDNPQYYNIKGICLNHLLIIKNSNMKVLTDSDLEILNQNYFHLQKNVITNGSKATDSYIYEIYISKKFGFRPLNDKNMSAVYGKIKNENYNYIFKEDYIFIPEFHQLVPLDYNNLDKQEDLEYYTITKTDAVCVIPELSYGRSIEGFDWEFINASRPLDKPIQLKNIKEPFIARDENASELNPGYYNIRFNYRLTNEDKINTIELNSAFKKV